jgi:hypothetical protein
MLDLLANGGNIRQDILLTIAKGIYMERNIHVYTTPLSTPDSTSHNFASPPPPFLPPFLPLACHPNSSFAPLPASIITLTTHTFPLLNPSLAALSSSSGVRTKNPTPPHISAIFSYPTSHPKLVLRSPPVGFPEAVAACSASQWSAESESPW